MDSLCMTTMLYNLVNSREATRLSVQAHPVHHYQVYACVAQLLHKLQHLLKETPGHQVKCRFALSP